MPRSIIAVVTLLTIIPPAHADDAYDAAAWAPANSVAVIAWSGADAAASGFNKSRLGKFYAQQEIAEFLNTPAASGWKAVRKAARKDMSAENLAAIEGLLQQIWRQPGMIAVFPVDADKNWPIPIGAAMVWKLDAEGAKRVAKLQKMLMDDADAKAEEIEGVKFKRVNSSVPLYMATHEGRWLVAWSRAAAEKVAKKPADDEGFAKNEAHVRARKAMGDLKPFFYTFEDVNAARAMFLDVVAKANHAGGDDAGNDSDKPDSEKPEGEDAEKEGEDANSSEVPHQVNEQRTNLLTSMAVSVVASRFLLGGAVAGSAEYARAISFNGPHIETTAYARTDDAHPFLFDYADATPLKREWIEQIPDDAIYYEVSTLDLATMYRATLTTFDALWAEIVQRAPQLAKGGPPANMQQFLREQTGMDIEKDVLAFFGTHLVTYTRPGLASLAMAIEVTDMDGVQKLIDRLLPMAPQLKFTERKAGNAVVHVLKMGSGMMLPLPISPAWSLSNNRLVIGMDFAAVKQLVRAGSGSKTTETADANTDDEAEKPSHAALTKFLEEHKDDKLTAVRWRDEEALFTPLYAQLTLLYPMATNAIQNAEPAMKFGPLPGMKKFTKYMAQTVGYTTVDGNVRISHDRSNLPIIAPSLDVTTMAMGTSILLPSLSRARELSKRTVCASNLRGIGQAMYIHAQDGDKFPNDFETLIKENNATAKQFHCPSSDADPDDLHSCYVLIPGQATSDDPTMVIAYEKNCHGDEGGNVLFLDGHVEFVTPYSRVKELVKKTKEHLAKKKK